MSAGGIFVVDSFLDTVDADPGDGQALDDQGRTTLRAAIQESNAREGEFTIILDVGTYTLTLSGTDEDSAATGDLDIVGDVTILGVEADQTTIDGAGIDRVLDVRPGGILNLSKLSIRHGDAAGSNDGGGIRNQAALTITESIISDNMAGRNGGGVYNAGTATVTNSTFTANSAVERGGGIDNTGTFDATNSTLSGNSVTGSLAVGGGIANASLATLTLLNVTVAVNDAGGAGARGGGIYNDGTANVLNTLIADNAADSLEDDAVGFFASQGYNLIETITGSAGWLGTDLYGVDPQLGPLQQYEGTTPTHTLLLGSPALDAGSNVGAPATDQRGVARPQDADHDGTATVDIGAFERYHGEIHGVQFHDVDGDRVRDANEPGLVGWTVFLDTNGNATLDPGEPSTLTRDDDPTTPGVDEAGTYSFTGLLPETYSVAGTPPPGWEQTAPAGGYTPGQYVVDSMADAADAAPGDGQARDAAGNTTLRAAIMEANALGGARTIVLGAGTFALSIAGSGEDEAATGDLDVLADITIMGAGAKRTIVNAAKLDRVFDVLPGGVLRLSGVTIAGGEVIGGNDGGGIRNGGTLSLTRCVVSGNQAGQNGGAILNTATLTLSQTTVAGNTSAQHGGGIYSTGTFSLTASTISGNTAAGSGGGIYNAGTLTAANDTLSGNSAGIQGGGLYNAASGSSTTTNCTVAENIAGSANTEQDDGGGIYNAAGATTNLKNTLVVANTAVHESPDVAGALNSLTHNMVGTLGNATGLRADSGLLQGETQVGAGYPGDAPWSSVATDGVLSVVAWLGNQDGTPTVYVQRYDSAGSPLGSATAVGSTFWSTSPVDSVAMDSGGNFVVVWETTDADGHGIKAQRYWADGTPRGTAIAVNTHETGDQTSPSIAMSSSGSFVVVWTDFSEKDGDGLGVFGRRFASDGVAFGDDFCLSTTTKGNQSQPSAAMDNGGNFVASWLGARPDGTGFGVYAQRYDSLAVPVDSEFRADTRFTGGQSNPSVSMTDSGGFIIAWSDRDSVRGQRYDSAGASQGANFVVEERTPSWGFSGPFNYPAGGSSTSSTAVGDFNADGKPDLVVVNRASVGSVSLLHGDGAGRFTIVGTYATSEYWPRSVSVGDFNEDGYPDLVVTHSDRIGIMLNDGNGGFAPEVIHVAHGIQWSVLVADFNGDGHADLAFDSNSTFIGIKLGNGRGGFSSTVTYSAGGDRAYHPDVGDFNSDGKLDLAIACPDPEHRTHRVGILFGNGDGTFGYPTMYDPGGEGSSPWFVAVGDFNVDGKVDVAVAKYWNHNVGILLGDGSGGFGNAVSYSSGGERPNSIAVGDYNADGYPDLAVTNYSGELGVLFGNGSGGFASPIIYDGFGGYPDLVISHDFNLDGKQDLAIANSTSNVVIFIGKSGAPERASVAIDGTGGFAVAWQTPEQIGDDYDIHLQRFDSSGGLIGSEYTVNTTTAGQQRSARIASAPDGNLFVTWASDTSGQHSLYDIYTARFGSTDRLLPSAATYLGPLDDNGGPTRTHALLPGSPAIDAGHNNGVPTTDQRGAPRFVDGNADGTATVDIGAVEFGSTPPEQPAESAGRWTVELGVGSVFSQIDFGNRALPGEIHGRKFNDLDGDGFKDPGEPGLAGWEIYLDLDDDGQRDSDEPKVKTDSNGQYSFTDLAPLTTYVVREVDEQDWNQTFPGPSQGKKWILQVTAGTVYNNIDFGNFYNPGGGQSGDGLIKGRVYNDVNQNGEYDAGEPGYVGRTVFLDFDDDGVLDPEDLVTTTFPDFPFTPEDEAGTYVFPGLTPGVYVVRTVLDAEMSTSKPLGNQLDVTSFPVGFNPRSIAVGDFDQDADLDLAVANANSNNVSVLLNDGSGSFVLTRTYAVGIQPYSIVAARLNDDNRVDLAVVNYFSSTVSVLLSNGSGTFAPAVTYSAGFLPGSLTVGDFNGDGFSDLAVANDFAGQVTVLLNRGDGTFAAGVPYGVGTSPFSVIAGHFNADDDLDLAVANFGDPLNGYSGSSVTLLLNDGDGKFTAIRNLTAGLGPSCVAVADLNGDGYSDLAVSNYGSDDVSVFWSNGDGTFAAAMNVPAGPAPFSVTAADFDADGDIDLAVANKTDEHLSIIRNRGDGSFEPPENFGVADFTTDSSSYSVTHADLNGDNTVDLVVSSGVSNSVSILLNEIAAGAHRVRIVDNDTVSDLDFGLVLPGATSPVVTAFTPTPSGYVVDLSHPIDAAALNLYDVENGRLGPADALLTGETVGPVAGSLIIDERRVTFIATGGPLPADTYTVRLRSATDGFRRALSGVLLDGDADRVPGGDFVQQFTLAAQASIVVSLPDFARGPGQSVTVPAAEAGLPLTVSDGTGIESVDLTILFDPALLTVTGAVPGPDAPLGSSVNVDTRLPGELRLTFHTTAPLAGGPAEFVTLTATVPETATYDAAHVLDITGLQVNGDPLAATADDAVHAVVYFGDTTGDGTYSGLDAQRIARVVVGLDTGFDAYPLIDPAIIADITSDGVLSGLDAVLVACEVVGLDPAEIPPLPSPQRALGAANLMAGDATPTTRSSLPALAAMPEGEAASAAAVNESGSLAPLAQAASVGSSPRRAGRDTFATGCPWYLPNEGSASPLPVYVSSLRRSLSAAAVDSFLRSEEAEVVTCLEEESDSVFDEDFCDDLAKDAVCQLIP